MSLGSKNFFQKGHMFAKGSSSNAGQFHPRSGSAANRFLGYFNIARFLQSTDMRA